MEIYKVRGSREFVLSCRGLYYVGTLTSLKEATVHVMNHISVIKEPIPVVGVVVLNDGSGELEIGVCSDSLDFNKRRVVLNGYENSLRERKLLQDSVCFSVIDCGNYVLSYYFMKLHSFKGLKSI